MSATSIAGKPFVTVRRFSRWAVALTVGLSLIFKSTLGAESLGWQIALALLALALGIPHGAVDHLITIDRTSSLRYWTFITLYIVVAIVAALAIFHWNVIGFQIVVAMSALHFGFGDASFLSESGSSALNRLATVLYALAAGSLPVVIPLVNSQSTSALARVHPELIGWAHGATRPLQSLVWVITALALTYLLLQRGYREALDIALLALLALLTPPLVAFAVYFGCWHAVRHTARLTRLLPSTATPLWSAFKAGLPALVGTILIATGFARFDQRGLSSSLLWSLLVVIWALTVPHMATTARFDFRSLK